MDPTVAAPVPIPASRIDTPSQDSPRALGQLDASRLIYNINTHPAPLPDESTLRSGDETRCTDHMVTAVWRASKGWDAPEIRPYGPFSLMPTASVLHYATECFEGMKAYRGFDGKLRLFRPQRNCARFNISAERIALPTFDPLEMQRLIVALLAVDAPHCLPKDRAGTFLYLRPMMFGTQPQLGVQAPKQAMLCIVASFLPSMDDPPGGLRLYTSPVDMVRAWVGGFGYAKIGANYGPTMVAKRNAAGAGFHEVLWLYGPRGECTEAGASNFFIVWQRKDGVVELVTAPLDDKLILDGVVRGSCLELARRHLEGRVEVVERKFSIEDVLDANAESRLLEAFTTGTGYFVCPVSKIHHRGKDINFAPSAGWRSGEITTEIKTRLGDILYGRTPHEWCFVVEEKA